MSEPILIGTVKSGRRVEIARSFSLKVNLGNYESADFFCSEKSEVDAEDQEQASAALYAFCKRQVLASADEFKKSRMAPAGRKEVA